MQLVVLEDNLGDPPDGVGFNFESVVVQYDEDSSKKMVERRIIPHPSWLIDPDHEIPTIQQYVIGMVELGLMVTDTPLIRGGFSGMGQLISVVILPII